jgi:hypothetical protein
MSRMLPPITMDLSQWAENLRRYLGRALDQLGFKETYSSASENGVMLWDNVNGYPVVSKNGEWRQVVLGADFIYIRKHCSFLFLAKR